LQQNNIIYADPNSHQTCTSHISNQYTSIQKGSSFPHTHPQHGKNKASVS